MNQEILCNLATNSIENDILKNIDFKNILLEFAQEKKSILYNQMFLFCNFLCV